MNEETILPIEWREIDVAVSQLRPHERNPRQISENAYKRLKAAIQTLGIHQRVLCQPDLKVIGGHMRLKVYNELGIKRVKALVPSRPLTDKEFQQAMVQDNLPFGEWDMDIISADFHRNELIDWGMPAAWVTGEASGMGGGGDGTGTGQKKAVCCPACGEQFIPGDHDAKKA